MTIGYGVGDVFFNECWEALVFIVAQSMIGLFLDALCFGFIYTRIANPENRAVSLMGVIVVLIVTMVRMTMMVTIETAANLFLLLSFSLLWLLTLV